MKYLAFLLAFIPAVAFGQTYHEIYRAATPSQLLPFDASSGSWVITVPIFHRNVELTCTVSCYVTFQVTTTSVPPATAATGVYIPADTPKRYIVNNNSYIYVIGGSGSGSLHVQEIAK